LLGLSVYVSWTISRMQGTHAAHSHPEHSEILHVAAALSSVAITYAGLAFLYKVVPNARVRFRYALFAAFAAGNRLGGRQVPLRLGLFTDGAGAPDLRLGRRAADHAHLDLHLLVHRAGGMQAVLRAGRVAQARAAPCTPGGGGPGNVRDPPHRGAPAAPP